MKKIEPRKTFSFKITDLIPVDVFHSSMLAGALIFFPSLFILTANRFDNWLGIFAERLLMLLLFIIIGAIGPKTCRLVLMIIMMILNSVGPMLA